jgi:hypothetical protein
MIVPLGSVGPCSIGEMIVPITAAKPRFRNAQCVALGIGIPQDKARQARFNRREEKHQHRCPFLTRFQR